MVLEDEQDYLPLFRSPLQRDQPGEGDLENQKTSLLHGQSRHSSNDQTATAKAHNEEECPQFRRFLRSTNVELFYDLFFVANLTVFTYIHEVNDTESLKQYVGFFSILWFTWYQVGLYDVRFAMDSVFERFAKAIQFLVLITFAIVAPRFNVGVRADAENLESPELRYFRALTLALMVSRLVLVVQYLQTTWFARDLHKQVIVPMLLIALTYFCAAMIYLGLFWSFTLNAEGKNESYIVWYVLAILETVLVTAVSMVWRNISFIGTHLVERMSLLTLVIFGEGAIAIAKSCSYVVGEDSLFSLRGTVPVMILCATLNLYQLYHIYFDWIQEETFGTMRQQIWSFLHFPLHIALVLAVEGASQAITWNAAINYDKGLEKELRVWAAAFDNSTIPHWNASTFADAAVELNRTAVEVLGLQIAWEPDLLGILEATGIYGQAQQAAIPAIANGAHDWRAAANALAWLSGQFFTAVFKTAGFGAPESPADISETYALFHDGPIDFADPSEDFQGEAMTEISSVYHVFKLTYIYFFVATGCFVLLCVALASLNRGSKTRVFWPKLVFTGAVGLGLALQASVAATKAVEEYILSPWILPTVTICLFAVTVLNGVKLPLKKQKQRR